MKRIDRTTTIVFNDAELDAEISTANRAWINKLEDLVEEGVAEELEPTLEGHRDFKVPKKTIYRPRKPREWTEEQKEEARERLARVREQVQAAREAEAEDEDEADAEDEDEDEAGESRVGRISKARKERTE